jgi:hypothetical protein
MPVEILIRCGARGLLVALLLFLAPAARADGSHCDVCGAAFTDLIYTREDVVTGEKRQLCKSCALLKTACFFCGIPVKTNFTALKDGRYICARDAQTAILDEEEARNVCRDAKNSLDRVFARFLDFPDTNVTVRIVDRVHLRELFKEPGQEYVCPNVWGYIQTRTNRQQGLEHAMSLLSGLPRASFRATCAHEYAHAWLNQNLTAKRKGTLGRDANEGFCELVAYLLMDAEREEAQKRAILANAYTRGQVRLFIDAERAYGVNEIADWMRFGVDDQLSADSLQRVRAVETPRPAAAFASSPVRSRATAAAPAVLALKAVFLSPNRPEAVINNHTFAPNDTASVRVGETNVTVKCLAIGENFARIKLVDTGEERELRLKQSD